MLDDARTRLERRDAAGAFLLLAAAESVRAGDARFDYLLGVAAIDSGHVTRAIFALERVVDSNPADGLARAELGRAYLAAGDADAAREQWRQARAGRLPTEAAAAIDRVIGVVDQVSPTARPQVSGYVELGAGYDSNVNSATHEGEFAIPAFGGIVFQTTPENRQRDDWVTYAAGGVAAEAALSPTWQLVGAANLHTAVDRVVHDMNTMFFDATSGLRHTAGTHSQIVALQNNTAWVGGSLYRTANGLSAQWQSQLGNAAQVSLFAQGSHQVYSHQTERNTNRLLLGVGAARQFSGNGPLVYGSAYLTRERALSNGNDHFGHHDIGLRVGLEQRVTPAITAFGEFQFERRNHGGTEPFFDTARRDRQSDLGAGLRWQPDPCWQLVAQARRAQVASNVVLYDYTRSVFQITAHRSFQ